MDTISKSKDQPVENLSETTDDPTGSGAETAKEGRHTLFEIEGLDEGLARDGDITNGALPRADIARQAGYDEDGPEPLGGPTTDSYEGAVPVFQWEINPQDSDAKSGTAEITLNGWDFRVWWQVHGTGLIYASIQAMLNDSVEHDGSARPHPVGRTEAVNLVYDEQRKGVVAIYGTVRDFRPFVDAFHSGYILRS